MRVELFFVVIEDEERLGLARDHVVEITVAIRRGEFASDHRHAMFRGRDLEAVNNVVSHDLSRIEETATEFGLLVPAVCKCGEAA